MNKPCRLHWVFQVGVDNVSKESMSLPIEVNLRSPLFSTRLMTAKHLNYAKEYIPTTELFDIQSKQQTKLPNLISWRRAITFIFHRFQICLFG